MITLFAAGAGFGLPEISPYVTKTEVQLMMAGLDYKKTKGSRETAPKAATPNLFIGADGKPLALLPADTPNTEANEGDPKLVAAELGKWVR